MYLFTHVDNIYNDSLLVFALECSKFIGSPKDGLCYIPFGIRGSKLGVNYKFPEIVSTDRPSYGIPEECFKRSSLPRRVLFKAQTRSAYNGSEGLFSSLLN